MFIISKENRKNPCGDCIKITAQYLAKLLEQDYSKDGENIRAKAVRRSSAGTRGVTKAQKQVNIVRPELVGIYQLCQNLTLISAVFLCLFPLRLTDE